jgi:hypothetical protein
VVVNDLLEAFVKDGALGLYPSFVSFHVFEDVDFHRFWSHKEVI